MKKKTLLLCSAGAIVCLTTSLWAKDDLPTTEPFSRYQPMVQRSPFTVATAAGPMGATPDFAKNLYVANAAHSTGADYVTIASTVDKNLKEYLNTRDVVDGYSISNIQWSDRVGETKVTISKDGQFATLTFNEALLSQAIPVQQAPQLPQIPGRQMPPHPPQRIPTPIQRPIQRPMPVPHIPTPAPHTRSTIHRQHPQNLQQVENGDDFDSQ